MRAPLLLLSLLLLVSLPAWAADAPGEKQVTTLLERWIAAQNTGDLETYKSLYASTFEGVRRSGKKATTFDRAGWLADRAKMFQKPMKVSAADAKTTIAGGKATVRFTQTWSSGAYIDTGTKEIVVVLDGGEARIAREEMLDSKVLPRIVAKFILVPTSDEDTDVTLELLGSVKKTYSMGIGQFCGAQSAGRPMKEEDFANVACGQGDCSTVYWVRRKGSKLTVGETSGCSVGEDEKYSDTLMDTVTVPAGADVILEVEERLPEGD